MFGRRFRQDARAKLRATAPPALHSPRRIEMREYTLVSMRKGFVAFFCMMRIAFAADPVESLHKLFKDEWEYTMEQAPAWASQLGDRRWNEQWGDASLEA